MKNLVFYRYSFVVLSFIFSACSKDSSKTSSNTGSAALTVSQSVIKRGEPLVATAPLGFSSSTIKWTVSPSSATYISSANSQAMVLIASPGTYQIKATGAGADSIVRDSSFASITVTDSVYAPATDNNLDTVSLTGDKVILTPLADTASGLLLLAQTSKSYDCFPGFIYSVTQGLNGNGGISLDFYNIVTGSYYGSCNGVKNHAASYLFLGDFTHGLPIGNYPFSVTVNNITYQGSLAVSGTDYTFTWDDDSGVIISPKQIKKK